MQAAGGEIEPGKIEGKTQTASISVIVQYPLRHTAHGDDSLDAFRNGRSVAFCGQPVIESLSPHTDRFFQMPALLADEGAQARQHADLAEARAQLRVAGVSHALAD